MKKLISKHWRTSLGTLLLLGVITFLYYGQKNVLPSNGVSGKKMPSSEKSVDSVRLYRTNVPSPLYGPEPKQDGC